MSPISATICEDPADLAGWLEGVIVRGEMPLLAGELQVIHGIELNNQPTLGQVCGEHLDSVIRSGISILPRSVIQAMLKQPGLLVELAERILIEGGDYWDRRLAAEPGANDRIEQSLKELESSLPAKDSTLPMAMEVSREGNRQKWYFAPWLVSSLTAAAVLAMITLVPEIQQHIAPGPSKVTVVPVNRWGWMKADELPQTATPPEYLDSVAKLIEEWGDRKPEPAVMLAERIGELRTGCSRIQLMEHPLKQREREWLVAKCQKWSKEIDKQLGELETTGDTVKVHANVSQMVAKICAALRTEANRLRQEA